MAWDDAVRVVFGDFGQMTTRERNSLCGRGHTPYPDYTIPP
ncbi:MAG: hypothetical protein M3Z08_12375 [Chloroflexota bacterium]|nr:hypothetical protein [Chloroflexota bacterium]